MTDESGAKGPEATRLMNEPAAERRLATIDEVEAILATPGVCGLDFETTIDRGWKREVCTVQLAHEDGREAFLYVRGLPNRQKRLARALTASPAKLVAHFAVFEWECLHKLGARPKDVCCTYIAARVLRGAMVGDDNEDGNEEGGYGDWSLADLAWSLFQLEVDKTLQKTDWTQPPTPEMIEYGLIDARVARDFWFVFEAEFTADPDQWRGFTVVNDAVEVAARCNLHGGVEFDRDAHKALCIRFDNQLQLHQFEMDITSLDAVANHASGPQVSRWIADTLFDTPRLERIASLLFTQVTGTNWGLTAGGQIRLDKNTISRVLEDVEIVNPRVGAYLRARAQYQREKKLLDAFGPKLATLVDEDGCIRGSFIPHGARTSRGSMRDPNLQQMPADEEFRSCFRARKGRKLVICDYGQIELRTGCIIADDKRMQLIFQEGFDIHAATAVAVFALGAYDENNPAHRAARKKAKAPNFAALYGAMANTISMSTGLPIAEARELLGKWLETYPGIAKYREEMPVIGREQGFVQLASGQKIKVLENTRPAQMINAPVQGGSASVMYRAARRVYDRLEADGLDAVLCLLVHDELIVDSAEECAVEVARVMQEEMIAALLEFFPRAADLGLDNVADASICDIWAQKDGPEYKLHNYIERMAA